MARDLSVEVREFAVAKVAAAAPVAALAEDRVYGPSVPDKPGWPFVRTDLPVVTPNPDACGDGSRYAFNFHGFARGPDERNAARLGAALAAAADELAGELDVVPGATVTDTVWTGTQVFRDIPEPDGWHAVVSVYCLVDG